MVRCSQLFCTSFQDGKKALINMQENNAVAVLDLETLAIASVVSFGEKDFSLPGNEFDAAEDGNIELKNWPIFGFYQPDVIKTFTHEGKVRANAERRAYAAHKVKHIATLYNVPLHDSWT